jgi:hypothetical protein
MTTSLSQQILSDSNRSAIIKYVGTVDTLANLNILLDAASLEHSLNANGYVMGTTSTDRKKSYGLSIKRIFGQGQFKSGGHMTLYWEDNANNAIVTIGNGPFDYTLDVQGSAGSMGFANNDPAANCTGNIRFTTVGVAAPDSVTLFISVRKSTSDYDQGTIL